MNEADIVRLLTRGSDDPRALGFDDDVSIVDGAIVTSVDMLVEDVDFRLRTFSAQDVAHKALAVNVSDLAAAGAAPTGTLLALALPSRVDDAWIEAFAAGWLEATRAWKCPLLGGDLSKTGGPITLAVTVFGRAATPVRRRGGAVGDLLCVSGELGAAAAGLLLLERDVVGFDRLKTKQRRPTPRLDLSLQGALAAIDLSDGLAADLPRLLPRGVHARLDLATLPIADDTRAAAAALGVDPIALATRGGEDFELLAVFPRAAKVPTGFTRIGELAAEGTDLGSGFDHFA